MAILCIHHILIRNERMTAEQQQTPSSARPAASDGRNADFVSLHRNVTQRGRFAVSAECWKRRPCNRFGWWGCVNSPAASTGSSGAGFSQSTLLEFILIFDLFAPYRPVAKLSWIFRGSIRDFFHEHGKLLLVFGAFVVEVMFTQWSQIPVC